MTNCLVPKGDFPIKITWILNGKSVIDLVGVSVLNTNRRSSQLSIDSVQAHHAGEYVCNATNPAGGTSYAATLNVNSTFTFFWPYVFRYVFSKSTSFLEFRNKSQ